jgi:hypothetical protein
VNVKAGQLLRVTATGTWTDGSTTSGPDGAKKLWPDNFFNLADLGACNYCAKTASSQWGALIGYVGTSPPAPGSYTSAAVRSQALRVFYVGSNYEALVLESGKLWLSKNADAYSNYTADNSGDVTAKITILPPESASQVAARGRTAALSVESATPLQAAKNACAQSLRDAARNAVVALIIKGMMRRDDIAGAYEGATIIGDYIKINYDLSNGQIGSAEFDIGKLIFAAIGAAPELAPEVPPQFALFGIIGEPAIDCVEAGFWLDGYLGGQLGRYLRQKIWPPSTAGASIAGTWTLAKTTVTCVNLPAGCSTSPMILRFSNCTQTKCNMSRLHYTWKKSHVIQLHGNTWTAKFTDITASCGAQQNPAGVTINLSVTKSHKHNGTELGGTYAVTVKTNPPNCPGNASSMQDLHGGRS